VVRSYSPLVTIGGGEVLDAFATRHKRFSASLEEELGILERGSEEEKLKLYLLKAGAAGLSFEEWQMRSNLPPSRLRSSVSALQSKGEIQGYDGDRLRYVHPRVMEDLVRFSLDYLKDFHQKNPLLEGAMKEEIKSKLPPQVDPRLFQHLLSMLIGQKKIAVEKEMIRLAFHKVSLRAEDEDLRKKMVHLYERGKLQPPTVKEVAQELQARESEVKLVLQLLVKEELLVKVKDDLYFHRPAVDDLTARMVSFLEKNQEMTPTQFKDVSRVSRKFAIPLMEYFDGKKVTMRIGDKRILRK
jgi:selenocysteine-specific elongation factor